MPSLRELYGRQAQRSEIAETNQRVLALPIGMGCLEFMESDGQPTLPDQALNSIREARICDETHGNANMAMTNPLQFIQQVRAEVAKVVWPARREVVLTSAMVFMLTIATAAFFFLVDFLIRQGLQGILSIFG